MTARNTWKFPSPTWPTIVPEKYGMVKEFLLRIYMRKTHMEISIVRITSALQSKNTVSAFHFHAILSFKKLVDNQCSSITKGSIYHIKYYLHTTFYHSSGLTRNWIFN